MRKIKPHELIQITITINCPVKEKLFSMEIDPSNIGATVEKVPYSLNDDSYYAERYLSFTCPLCKKYHEIEL